MEHKTKNKKGKKRTWLFNEKTLGILHCFYEEKNSFPLVPSSMIRAPWKDYLSFP